MNILDLMNVNTVLFTLWNYQMSYLEFFGTIFTGLSVYLAAKNKVSTWPIGVIGIIFYGFLFFQIQLYSDFIEQIYYFVIGFWGWWVWTHPKNDTDRDGDKQQKIEYSPTKTNYAFGILIALMSIGLGYFISKVHLIYPQLFPIPASFPYLDAFTTVMSFVANIYLAKRRIENWYLWIIVDVIGVGLYYQKGVFFLSLLYLLFLINAFAGLYKWIRIYKNYENEKI
jgi:nicotinamide mononucleotide transporter